MIPLFRVRCDHETYFRLARPCFERGFIGEGPVVVEFEYA